MGRRLPMSKKRPGDEGKTDCCWTAKLSSRGGQEERADLEAAAAARVESVAEGEAGAGTWSLGKSWKLPKRSVVLSWPGMPAMLKIGTRRGRGD